MTSIYKKIIVTNCAIARVVKREVVCTVTKFLLIAIDCNFILRARYMNKIN